MKADPVSRLIGSLPYQNRPALPLGAGPYTPVFSYNLCDHIAPPRYPMLLAADFYSASAAP